MKATSVFLVRSKESTDCLKYDEMACSTSAPAQVFSSFRRMLLFLGGGGGGRGRRAADDGVIDGGGGSGGGGGGGGSCVLLLLGDKFGGICRIRRM